MHEFKTYHPIVNVAYFVFVIVFSCAILHPVFLGISFVCSAIFAVMNGGMRTFKFICFYVLPLMIVAAVINPAFNHGGVTVLTYLPSGNPLTYESIVYGLAMAVMLGSVLCVFSSFNNIMTSDKFTYLLGRIIPSMSLIFSMVLRFVPGFKTRLIQVAAGQKCIGRDARHGNIIRRAKNGLGILSIMVTWSLENAIETADSMKSRGYGLPGRTAYSNFSFDTRDRMALTAIFALGIYVMAGWITGAVKYRYMPSVYIGEVTSCSVSVFVAYLILCALPIIIECWEARKWKLLRRKI